MKNRTRIKYVINGKSLGRTLTGVQRYFIETIKELDKIVPDKYMEIAVPHGTNISSEFQNLRNIDIVEVGYKKGVFWVQWELLRYIRKNRSTGIHLCGSPPLLQPDIVCLHDVSPVINKGLFSRKFTLWYAILCFACSHFAKQIITVSEFSKSEIKRIYPRIKTEIIVIPNAWQHMQNISEDDSILKEYNLEEKQYCFALGSMASNKNFDWILRVAKNNPKQKFVVSGGVNNKVYGRISISIVPENVQFIGYATDSQVKSLFKSCKAFLSPSFYEGFGLPPLEALSVGAKIIISDIDAHREVYEDSAIYVDPYEPDVDLDELLKQETGDAKRILAKYSWKQTAEKIWEVVSSNA